MGILQVLLLLVYLLVAAGLIWVVILQEPKTGGGDLFGGGATDLFAARGLTGGLYRVTIYLGFAFLFLALLIGTWQL
ncbi:MAG TPA: preprotein translocase subunit SecG [Oceanithermus sp.]|nr:preprotein translocase subunit SecG [Oceanithermus sp.]